MQFFSQRIVSQMLISLLLVCAIALPVRADTTEEPLSAPVFSLDDIWQAITADDLDPADDPLASVNLSRSQKALKQEALLQSLYFKQAQAYTGLIQAGLANEAAARQVSRAQQQWHDAQTAFDAGKVFQFDVVKAEAAIIAAGQAQLKSRQQYEETLRQMVLPGNPPARHMRPAELAERMKFTLDGRIDTPLDGLKTLKELPEDLPWETLMAMSEKDLLSVAEAHRSDWELAQKVKLNDQVHRAYLHLKRTMPMDITASRQAIRTAEELYGLSLQQEELAQDVFNQVQKSVQGGFSSQRDLDDARYTLLQAQDATLLAGMAWRLSAIRFLHTLGLLHPAVGLP